MHMPTPGEKPDKYLIKGSGVLISVKLTPDQIRPHRLTRVGAATCKLTDWSLAWFGDNGRYEVFFEDTLVAIYVRLREHLKKPMTMTSLFQFLADFTLTMQTVFDDNPAATVALMKTMCSALSANHPVDGQGLTAEIAVLQNLFGQLVSEPAKPLKQAIETMVKELKRPSAQKPSTSAQKAKQPAEPVPAK